MKAQKSFALLDALVLTAALIVMLVLFSPPAHAVEGDYRGLDTETLFDVCRGDTRGNKIICSTYIVAIWDVMSANPHLCMNLEVVDDATLVAIVSNVAKMIRMTSGYSTEPNAPDALYHMLHAQGAYTVCPGGRSQ